MVAKSTDESRADRERLRDALRRRGHDSVDQIAAAIRERWHHGHLRSYRLAAELSQSQVCDQVNALQGAHFGETGYLDPSILSKFEHWPAYGRRPSAGYLVALAKVYRTSPRNLIADVDWDAFPPLDRHTVTTLDQATTTGTVTPATTTGMMETTRPQAGDPPRTPPNWWVSPDTFRSGNPIERAVTMANDESTRYADRGSNIGPATLEQLRDNVAQVSGRFANGPRGLELFGSVRMLRDRIFGHLDGGQQIQQRRDLYFLSAAACGLLAVISDDLGYKDAGMSQARVAHVFATEAGDPALTAWLYSVQSMNRYWNGQPGKARDYARRGAALHPAGSVGVWLPAMEARASGALGDAEGAKLAVRRAVEIRETVRPNAVDGFGGIMHYSSAKQHFYAADAFLGIGDESAAIAQAAAAVDAYQNGPAEQYNVTDLAITHFDAAIAHVRTGDLDAVTESARAAFALGTGSRSSNVDTSARRLHRQLGAADVRTAPLAVETRDQIEDFLSATPTRFELS